MVEIITKKWAYYNEFKPEAAHMLRQLIKDGLIADGEVDERSIVDVRPEDVRGFIQAHWFAGIGGWSVALRLAGFPDDRPAWTGSCPCQPFSTAGKQKGKEDERHLWPVWFNLIRECKPDIIFYEQVASAIRHGWLDGVFDNLESINYSNEACVIPACSVGAPHKRDRIWGYAKKMPSMRTYSSDGEFFERSTEEGWTPEFVQEMRCSGLQGVSAKEQIKREGAPKKMGAAKSREGKKISSKLAGKQSHRLDNKHCPPSGKKEENRVRSGFSPRRFEEKSFHDEMRNYRDSSQSFAEKDDQLDFFRSYRPIERVCIRERKDNLLCDELRSRDMGRKSDKSPNEKMAGEINAGKTFDGTYVGKQQSRMYIQNKMENDPIGSAVLPACAVDAPHKRDRLWFVGNRENFGRNRRPKDAERERAEDKPVIFSDIRSESIGHGCVGDSQREGSQGHCGHDSSEERRQEQTRSTAETGFWDDHEWIVCGDGKARRIPTIKPDVLRLADGLQPRSPEEYADSMWIVTTEKIKGRKHLLHAIGNAIVPEVAARFIRATM